MSHRELCRNCREKSGTGNIVCLSDSSIASCDDETEMPDENTTENGKKQAEKQFLYESSLFVVTNAMPGETEGGTYNEEESTKESSAGVRKHKNNQMKQKKDAV